MSGGAVNFYAMVTIQNSLSIIVSDLGCPVVRSGPCRNVFVFSSLSDFFRVGGKLFDQGFVLLAPADYAKKSCVSRQAVDNWLWREGTRIALKYERAGKNLLFVISK